jgi:hypothetical protein
MKSLLGITSFLFVLALTLGSALLVARDPGSKTATATKASPQPTAVVKSPRTGVDPDKAYKAHCSSCHVEPRRYSDRATVTIVRHMRVRANLTAEEEKAILQYLTR